MALCQSQNGTCNHGSGESYPMGAQGSSSEQLTELCFTTGQQDSPQEICYLEKGM